MCCKSKYFHVCLLLVGIISFSGFAVASQTTVATFEELIAALDAASAGDTILLLDGTYQITGTWAIQVVTPGVTIKGASGDREAVVINGMGMNATGHHGFWVHADNVTIQDLTVQNVRNHCIQTHTDVDGLHVINCVLRDAGEQILKVPASTEVSSPSENGVVEQCLFEYSAGVGPRSYIGGIDVHKAKGWIVQDNVFQFIRSPGDTLAEHAVHFWTDSEDTLVQRNLIITCDRGIGFGLGASGHIGGIIRNNMIYHDGTPGFNDVGIGLESAVDTQVYNNTIYFNSDYSNAIEYRFAVTTGVDITNNLTNKQIRQRDGASATVANNITHAAASWFLNSAAVDLHLSGDAIEVLDQGLWVSGLDDDIDQDVRPMGTGIDIGADEFDACRADLDLDSDVDGYDLALLIAGSMLDCVSVFAESFGQP